ncbi:uncharacterized protein LOC115408282 [Salarias fasciatus]|uniref:Uncharacterized LOC115408282 n=1 Tax=Salarias fasciatus TaxID=181472 RepID=A0A672GWV4_SALFA|nr:uncharacterized protein LOC115408282 [Salarias fasciatus]
MNMFRRHEASAAPTPQLPPRPNRKDVDSTATQSVNTQGAGMAEAPQENNNEVLNEPNPKSKRTGMMGVMNKVNPFKSSSQASSSNSQSSSSESREQTDSTQNPGVFKGVMHKVNPFKSASQVPKAASSESLDQNPGMLKGAMQKVNPFKSTAKVPKNEVEEGSADPEEIGKEAHEGKQQNPGMITGMIHKMNPFKSSQPKDGRPLHDDLSSSRGSLADSTDSLEKQVLKNEVEEGSADPEETGKEAQEEKQQNPGMISGMFQKMNPFKSSQPKDGRPLDSDLSSSSGSLADSKDSLEKQPHAVGFRGMMQKVNPFKSHTQVVEGECETDSAAAAAAEGNKAIHSEHSSSSESLDDSTIERHSVWYVEDAGPKLQSQPAAVPKRRTVSFKLKRILPTSLFGSGTKDSTSASSDNPAPPQEVEVQTLEMVPEEHSEGTVLDPLDDEDGLLSWWRTVEGWDEWNEATKDDEAEEVVEEAADRVFMAARLFVRFFNQRGASLQKRILELLALADQADNFHKKTVTASVGGGVASVAGSVTTITGLILAPFTAGTSLIVTAVGIGIATAGGVASASANITDTVHSKTDRKKVEKMIQDYQEEMKDIKDCLDFLQEGMETLEEWNFEQYAESIAKKHLNQNVKHVMKEGGRAGKALVINTESLINTVQVLSVAGGAAKAAQVMSVTTGVMSGLFLALDVFFLAKDSMELKKGAKTEFAAKIRDVCKDLQGGLLELNNIKEQLQKTMDGIEVEVEEEEEDEEALKSDLKKLYELEEWQ